MKLIARLQKSATGRRVLVLLVITMALYVTILFYSIPAVTARAPGMRLFDMSPGGYSQSYSESLLAAIGPEGRDTYRHLQLPIDFIYPGLFAVTYTMMLAWLFKKSFDADSKIFLLALVPAAAGLFDYLENIGIMVILHSYPAVDPGAVLVSSMFSVLKSILTAVFYILLCYGFIVLFIKRKYGLSD